MATRGHAVVGGLGVDGVGLGGGEVGPGLANVLRAGAVEGFLEERGVLVEGGVGLGDLLGTVAALEAVVVGCGPGRRRLGPGRAGPGARGRRR